MRHRPGRPKPERETALRRRDLGGRQEGDRREKESKSFVEEFRFTDGGLVALGSLVILWAVRQHLSRGHFGSRQMFQTLIMSRIRKSATLKTVPLLKSVRVAESLTEADLIWLWVDLRAWGLQRPAKRVEQNQEGRERRGTLTDGCETPTGRCLWPLASEVASRPGYARGAALVRRAACVADGCSRGLRFLLYNLEDFLKRKLVLFKRQNECLFF